MATSLVQENKLVKSFFSFSTPETDQKDGQECQNQVGKIFGNCFLALSEKGSL